jgi:hypothetical protein
MVDFAPVGLGRSMAMIDQEVIISFKREDDSFAEYVYRPEALKTELDGIEAHLVGPSFLIEFEGGVLYTGGGGCFSLRAPLTPDQVQRLIGGVLRLLNLDIYPHKEVTGVALFDGRMVVIPAHRAADFPSCCPKLPQVSSFIP